MQSKKVVHFLLTCAVKMNNFGEDGSYWPWYHQNLSRMDGEQLLVETSQDGAFLVRSSDTVKGAYVLSLM